MADVIFRPSKSPLRTSMVNGIWMIFCDSTERAAGVYHREARSGRYKLTYAEAKAVCEFEGGRLATYKQLEAARKIGNWSNGISFFFPLEKKSSSSFP